MPLREKSITKIRAFIFPGQGRPYLGMGNRVYRDVPSIKVMGIVRGNSGVRCKDGLFKKAHE